MEKKLSNLFGYDMFILEIEIKDRYALLVAVLLLCMHACFELGLISFHFIFERKKNIFDYARDEWKEITWTQIQLNAEFLEWILWKPLNVMKTTRLLNFVTIALLLLLLISFSSIKTVVRRKKGENRWNEMKKKRNKNVCLSATVLRSAIV